MLQPQSVEIPRVVRPPSVQVQGPINGRKIFTYM
jgi:hypothetical protein